MPTYHSIYFGCRANQADTAAVERDLSQRGFRAAAHPDEADVVVVNSCTVTASADSELRQTVRRIHRENPRARILVTGCYAQRRPEELAALAGVEWVVGNSHKSEIARLVSETVASTDRQSGGKSFVPLRCLLSAASLSMDSDLRRLGSIVPSADVAPPSCVPTVLVGDIAAQRQFVAAPFFGGTVEDRTRPNLKIQDGCNNRCSFCIIPSVRGLSRSLPVADVLAQIRTLVAAGYREVVLSGVNLGQYGRDLARRAREQAGIRRNDALPGPLSYGRGSDRQHRFVPLLQTLLDETAVERLRLSSVEPMDFTDRLLDLMASTPRIARHVHAPLQSGSDRILRRMHRKYRAAQYRERVLAAYERMPEAAFGADVMVGFPGETNEDFEATRRLIEELPFTYLHVFPFSRRPGTPADGMQAQVNGAVVRERGRILRELAAEKNLRFRERHLGRTLRVLTLSETASDGTLALSDNYIKVIISGAPLPVNQWIRTRILSVADGCLTGAGVSLEKDLHRLEADSPSMMTCASA